MNTNPSMRKITVFDCLNALALILFALICTFPFYFILITSISDPSAVTRGQVLFLPKGIQFVNYSNVLKDPKIVDAAIVSVSRTVLGTLITVFCSSIVAYLVTKRQMFLRGFVYKMIVITMFFNAGIIPWYITMKNMGLKDNFLLYILPGAVAPFYIVLIKTYIEQLPQALEEAALLDGAGYLQIFFRIILPLSKPILATIVVFCAVGQWNSFQDNLFLVQERKLQTLQMLLYRYMNQVEAMAAMIRTSGVSSVAAMDGYKITPTAVRMTISMIVIFPILIIYPIMQRYFIKGIMIGAIKG